MNTKYLLNSNNEKIYVETYTPETINSTIVFCHGITGCRKGRTMNDNYFQVLAEKLMNQNYKVVLFDFSGHGESEGNDYDACLSKNVEELSLVFDNEVIDRHNVSFLVFSYGAAVLCKFLMNNQDIIPNKIVMYSPCLYPIESCFLTDKSIFGKDILTAYNNGSLEQNKYVVVGAKNFKFGMKMIDDCKSFKPDYYEKFRDRIIVLFGLDDVVLDTQYNEEFCNKYNLPKYYYKASHSLYEQLNDVFKLTIEYLTK